MTNRTSISIPWAGKVGTLRLFLAGAISAAIILPLVLEGSGYQWRHTFLAIVLIEICLYPTVRYFARQETDLPTMPIFSAAFALQFAIPIFTRDATIELAQGETRLLEDSDVTAALLLAIVGICALLAGYYAFQRIPFRKAVPVAQLHLNKTKAVLCCLLLGVVLPLLFNLRAIIPQEYQLPLSAILTLLQNQVYVVIGVLGWLVYGRKASKWYAVWLYALITVTALHGISTGILEEALIPIGVLFIIRWLYTQRISLPVAACVIALILFLSPVKGEYRQQLRSDDSSGAAEMSSLERATLWITQAGDYWAETFSGARGLVEATSSATGRADFLHQLAYTYSMTPEEVPYQYGRTYSYFAVALIPRALWPDKPLSGSANGFFAITYGLLTEEGAKTTTFGVSLVGEAFINFGWAGVVFVMLIQGLAIGVLERIFGSRKSGAGGQAVFIAFFVFFLNGIGSSAEILFGNILQNLLFGYLLLWWAREKRATFEPRRFREPVAAALTSGH
ncbi:MAG TPA: O-antigen polysaccharide polymerase Wzy [Pyrinomonadaceae bacterium]|nr:O-antigen polysaccharide polymerase Wzy [Pyrinomonadaceae bacterium]